MIKPVPLISLFLLLGVINGREKRIDSKIEQIEKGYNYSCNFQSTLSRDSVLAILFEFDHFVKYSSQMSQIELLSEEILLSGIVCMKFLIYSSRSVYRKLSGKKIWW